MTKTLAKKQSPVEGLKTVMASASVQEQFANALAEKSNLFVASLIDLYASDTYLQNCAPALVVAEALKAATLNLPINKSLGFAYIVPYKKQGKQIPQFQLGYKGMVQLAMRTGLYKYINADVVLEGEFKGFSKLTGELDIGGASTSDAVVGYFAHIETVNGFKKSMFVSKEDMEAHGKKYSKAYSKQFSPWQTEFDKMAIKTMLRMLLSKYGIMSIDMADGIAMEQSPETEYLGNANQEIIDITPQQDDHPRETTQEEVNVDTQTGEVLDAREPQPQPDEEPPAFTNEPTSAEVDRQLAASEEAHSHTGGPGY